MRKYGKGGGKSGIKSPVGKSIAGGRKVKGGRK